MIIQHTELKHFEMNCFAGHKVVFLRLLGCGCFSGFVRENTEKGLAEVLFPSPNSSEFGRTWPFAHESTTS